LKVRKYELNFNNICLISSSNFGTVCKSIGKRSEKTFAVKGIPLNESQRENVCKESNIIAELCDKYVVQYFDVWIKKNIFIKIKTLVINIRI
jgi:hypothetical protein